MRHDLIEIRMVLVIALGSWTPCFLGATETEGPESPSGQLESIREAQEGASRRYHEARDAAESEEQTRLAIDEFLAEVVENSDRALELARRHPEDPAALNALIFVIRTARAGPSDRSERAIALLARDHVRDERMGEVCQQIFYFFHLPAAEGLIRTVLDENPDHAAKGLACHALASFLGYQARMLRFLRENPERIADYVESQGESAIDAFLQDKDSDALDGEATAFFDRVVREFECVEYGRRTLGEIAEGELFKLRQLRIGGRAPEIDGEDVDGNRFQLSEYRGRVVVLTFSGNWCGPCRAMYPHGRELVERLKDRPFALLSVNTDDDRGTLRESIESGEITWRCWWDGSSEGPISTRWGVDAFPTIYVFDHEGIIRFRNIQGKELEDAVDRLIGEAELATNS